MGARVWEQEVTLEDLNAILESGRRYGLRFMRVDTIGLVVEYAQGPPPPIGEIKRITALVDAPMPEDAFPNTCPCGHSFYEHGPNGLCYFACGVEQCKPPKEATP